MLSVLNDYYCCNNRMRKTIKQTSKQTSKQTITIPYEIILKQFFCVCGAVRCVCVNEWRIWVSFRLKEVYQKGKKKKKKKKKLHIGFLVSESFRFVNRLSCSGQRSVMCMHCVWSRKPVMYLFLCCFFVFYFFFSCNEGMCS